MKTLLIFLAVASQAQAADILISWNGFQRTEHGAYVDLKVRRVMTKEEAKKLNEDRIEAQMKQVALVAR